MGAPAVYLTCLRAVLACRGALEGSLTAVAWAQAIWELSSVVPPRSTALMSPMTAAGPMRKPGSDLTAVPGTSEDAFPACGAVGEPTI